MADNEVVFDARLSTAGFAKDAGKLGDIVKGLGVFEVIKKGLALVTGAIDDAVKRYDTLNRFPKIMEQMGYGADVAKGSMEKLSDAIQGLPTTLDDIVGNTRQFTIALNDLDKGTDAAISVNNAFLASGASADEANRGLTQYLQMLSSGKVDMQSWKTLNETMTYGLQTVAESFGFAGASAKTDLYAALRDGDITMVQLTDRIIQLNDGVNGFAEVAKTATGGIGTAMVNLKSRTVQGVTAIIEAFDRGLSKTRFKSIENVINSMSTGIKNALISVAGVVEVLAANIEWLAPVVIGLTAAFAAYKAVVALANLDLQKHAILSALVAAKNVIVAVATGAQTVATAAAAAAQWALNAAMAANPIGLIIAGVIALVAGLIALFSWLGKGSEAYAAQKEEVEALAERQEALNDSISESAATHGDNVRAVNASNQEGQNYLATLKGMVDENGNLTASQEDAQQAINDLNSAYEGLNLSLNEETGQLSASVDEVEAYIAAKNSLAKTSVLDERRVELAREQAKVDAELAEATERYRLIEEDANLTDRERNKLLNELQDTINAYGNTQAALALDIEANNAAIEASTDSMANNTINQFEAINGARTSDGLNLKQLAKVYDTTTDQILADMEAQGISMDEWATRKAATMTEEGLTLEQLAAKWGMTSDEVTAYMDEWGMSLDEFSDEMDATHTSAGLSLEQLAAKWGTSTEEIKRQMAEQGISMQEWSDNLDSKCDEVINSFNEIPAEYDKTADEMISILQNNAERYSAWTQNIATLSETMSAEAIAELQKLGPEANSAIEEMIADPSKAAEFEESILAVMSAGAGGAEVGASDPRFVEAGSEVGAAVGEGLATSTEAQDAATQMIEDVATAADAAVATGNFTTVGQKIAQEIVTGVANSDMSGIGTALTTAINTGVTAASAAWSTMNSTMLGQFNTMKSNAVNSVSQMMTSVVSGISTRAGSAKSAATNVANGVTTALNTMIAKASSIAQQAMTGFTTQINTRAAAAKSAATNVANGVVQSLNPMIANAEGVASQAMSKVVNKLNSMAGSVSSAASAVGAAMMQGMVNGMNANANAVYAKADAIAAEVVRRLNKAFDIHSPSRVMAKLFGLVVEGMEVGLEDEESALYRQVDTLADGVLERLRRIPEDMAGALNQKLRLAIDTNQYAFAQLPAVAAAGVAPTGNITNINVEQTINSPRYTSPAENSRELEALMRRTKRQIK